MVTWNAVYWGSFGTLRVEQGWVDVTDPDDLPRSKLIPGRSSYWLNDEPISKDEFERLEEQAILERHRRRMSTV